MLQRPDATPGRPHRDDGRIPPPYQQVITCGRTTVPLPSSPIAIRIAGESDAEAVRRVKAPYIEATACNFAYEPPSADEVAADIRATLARYPFLVAERRMPDGVTRVLGFAQAEPYRSRAADRWNVELTIYLDADERGRGVGRALYEVLLGLLARQHVRNAYACVTATNAGSLAFHRALGFAEVGRFPATGYKLGAWHDTVYLWRCLGERGREPEPFIPYPELSGTGR